MPKSVLFFTRAQRLGLISLFAIVVALQVFILSSEFSPPELARDNSWLSVQKQIDSMRISTAVKPRHYPFNPNFITDYRGHVLGMSTGEIDRLHSFRAKGKYVNSAKEFQEVTGISDSLLKAISPYFKFPEWVTRKSTPSFKKEIAKPIDINAATKEELMAVYGIGDKLSDRILEMRQKLGGYVSMEQISDVWGLSPEVVVKVKERFYVSVKPEVPRIKVNQASLNELAAFPYFRYALARKIITRRSMNGVISDIDEISKIEGFPVEKKEIIAVYLDF
jgi:DNA uptake protein ComE-like DNA-binding protein